MQHIGQSNKILLWLRERNGLNRFMHSLLSESGKEITESKEIRKEAVAFYEDCIKVNRVEEEERNSQLLL